MSGQVVALTREEARASCDRQVAATLRPLFLATGILLLGFAAATPFLTPSTATGVIAGVQLALAVAFFGAHQVLRQARAARYVHPIFALLILGAFSTIVLTFLVTPTAVLTTGVILLIVGAGVIVLSWPWLIVIVAVNAGGWVALLIARSPPDDWHQAIFTLAAAGMIAGMAHAARLRTHLGLEALQRHEAGQRADLEAGIRALRETEARLRSVVRAAPVILLATDAAGVVTVAAGKGLEARGWDQADIVGKDARELLAAVGEEALHLERALLGESVAGVTEQDERTFETIWTPVLGPEDQVEGAICVAIDVTDRIKAAAEAQRAVEREVAIVRLKEMDQFKTRILNNASHELNTPLTPIKLQMHLLKASFGSLDARQQKAISVLDRNLERLSLLVGDIMDVARLEGGQMRFEPSEVDLAPLAVEAIVSFEAVANERGIHLRSTGADAPIMTQGDPRRLMQVVFNLLSNALKFTPADGHVTLEVEDAPEGAFLRVRDTGSGLEQAQIDKLFLPFSQVHDTSRSTHGGTGLGLYISKGIAEQHGGTLTCESGGPGKGTTFTMYLPRVLSL